MRTVTIIGHFSKKKQDLGGQTIKTKIIAEKLQNNCGKEQVLEIDTCGGLKTLFKSPFQAFRALRESKNVVIFPAHRALRVYAPLLFLERKLFFRERKLFYVVIGGWLPEYLTGKKALVKNLKSFDGIFVEMKSMKASLEKAGFVNVSVMPNCKPLKILSEEELVYSTTEPYKVCTFSRVCKQKGIEEAIDAVKAVNGRCGRVVLQLDIYGQVDDRQIEWFEGLKKNFPDFVRYGGLVDYDKSVDVLKNYFALLFPTKYYTEGIPGTIIDAYAAGVPVVSSKWENFSDIIKEGVTGFGYEFDNEAGLTEILLRLVGNPTIVLDMKESCLRESKKYLPEEVLKPLINELKR